MARKFKVLSLKEKIQRVRFITKKSEDGANVRIPMYYEVERGEPDPHRKNAVWLPSAYGHEDISVGDILEIEREDWANKAASNPQFEEVFDEPKEPEVPAPPVAKKKKRGRPPKKAA